MDFVRMRWKRRFTGRRDAIMYAEGPGNANDLTDLQDSLCPLRGNTIPVLSDAQSSGSCLASNLARPSTATDSHVHVEALDEIPSVQCDDRGSMHVSSHHTCECARQRAGRIYTLRVERRVPLVEVDRTCGATIHGEPILNHGEFRILWGR